jgi:pectate lyase
MRKLLTIILGVFCFSAINSQTLTHVVGLPEGFASLNGGVTGGEGGPVVTVTNAEELGAAVDGANTATIILVKGTINVVGEVPARGNKTIVGLGTDACIFGGGFGWNTKSNVIVQNITFGDAPDDLLKINNKCMNFWIDHCTFSDGADTNAGSHDGMLDVTRGSQYVTISYNKFFNHDKNILIGHSDSEVGDTIQKVTLHHNWFDKTIQRNPRVRFGTVHCYNNYYVANPTYSVASATNARVLIENCYFKSCPIPLQVGVPGFSPEGYLVQKGCFFESCGTPQTKDYNMEGLFPYPYKLDSVKYVPCIAETYVGATKTYRTIENFSCDDADNPNALLELRGNSQQMSFVENTLIFSSKNISPAEISIVTTDGRLIDIPFRGWVDAGVENKINLNTGSLSKGLYLIVFKTNAEKTVLKIQN